MSTQALQSEALNPNVCQAIVHGETGTIEAKEAQLDELVAARRFIASVAYKRNGSVEQHSAMTQPQMRDFNRHRRAVDQHAIGGVGRSRPELGSVFIAAQDELKLIEFAPGPTCSASATCRWACTATSKDARSLLRVTAISTLAGKSVFDNMGAAIGQAEIDPAKFMWKNATCGGPYNA